MYIFYFERQTKNHRERILHGCTKIQKVCLGVDKYVMSVYKLCVKYLLTREAKFGLQAVISYLGLLYLSSVSRFYLFI